jgi:hypothetical protein
VGDLEDLEVGDERLPQVARAGRGSVLSLARGAQFLLISDESPVCTCTDFPNASNALGMILYRTNGEQRLQKVESTGMEPSADSKLKSVRTLSRSANSPGNVLAVRVKAPSCCTEI